MIKSKYFKCILSPSNDDGEKVFALTLGRVYEVTSADFDEPGEDPEYIVVDDNGKTEKFFDLRIIFEEVEDHLIDKNMPF